MSFRFNPFLGILEFSGASTGPLVLSGNISSTSAIVADTIQLTTLKAITYKVSLWTATKSSQRTMEITYDTLNGLKEQVYARGGSDILVSLNAIVSGSNMNLIIENLESTTLNYSIYPTKLP